MEKALRLLYDSLDLIFHIHLKGWPPARIASETGVDQRSVEGNIERVAAKEHKRIPPAILRLS